MKTTTLNKIRACSPCISGWNKLLKHLGKTSADDELLPFEVILDSNSLEDALWCMRSAPEYDRECRLFAVWCAQQVQHINTDPRVGAAIKAAEDYANSRIRSDELAAAGAAARDAAGAAARAAAGAAEGAAEGAAARVAAWAAAGDAAGDAARDAAGDAARDAARDAAMDAQKEVFRWIVSGGLTKFEQSE